MLYDIVNFFWQHTNPQMLVGHKKTEPKNRSVLMFNVRFCDNNCNVFLLVGEHLKRSKRKGFETFAVSSSAHICKKLKNPEHFQEEIQGKFRRKSIKKSIWEICGQQRWLDLQERRRPGLPKENNIAAGGNGKPVPYCAIYIVILESTTRILTSKRPFKAVCLFVVCTYLFWRRPQISQFV